MIGKCLRLSWIPGVYASARPTTTPHFQPRPNSGFRTPSMFRTAISGCARAQLLTTTSSRSRLISTSHSFPTSSSLLLRTFSSGPSKPKPKASTPLRRAAAASQPIRSNPTPTRSEIKPVFTISTAERYDPRKLLLRLPDSTKVVDEACWIPKHGKGEIFVFPNNGSLVCWGLGEEEARKFAGQVLGFQGIQLGPFQEPETEELDFVTDPSEQTRLQGDLIILGKGQSETEVGSDVSSFSKSVFPQDTIMARYAFSQALSRSTSLSALEASLEEYLSSVENLPHSLEVTGKPGLRRRELIKKLGELMKFRQGLNLSRENFADTPDFYWTQPVLEGPCFPLSDPRFVIHPCNSRLLQLRQRCSGDQGENTFDQREDHLCR